MNTLLFFLSCVFLLSACGGNKNVVYRMEQNSPNPHNVIGITNAGGSTQAYGSIGFSAHGGR